MRISDAEREQVVGRLNTAVSEGRLTFAEFEERVDGVLRSRTYGEIEPFLVDLPAGPASPSMMPAMTGAPDLVELRNHASSLKRAGRWSVPRRLVVNSKAGTVRLNFADAAFAHQLVEIDLSVFASSVEVIVPAGASADIDSIETVASSVKSKIPATYDAPGPGVRLHLRGKLQASSLKIRYEYRFWRWRW
jgi:uncharacterized protein DUF1707